MKYEHGGVFAVWRIENPGGIFPGECLRDVIDNGSLIFRLLRTGHTGFLPFGDLVFLHDSGSGTGNDVEHLAGHFRPDQGFGIKIDGHEGFHRRCNGPDLSFHLAK